MEGVIEYDMTDVKGPLANTFVILINALFFNIKLIGIPDVYPKDYSECLLKEGEDVFDFVIVGAGSAGCSLANRLTENERWSVLLVEAGDYPSPTTEVPNLNSVLKGSDEDWNFILEKDDRACQSYTAGRCTVMRGKCLGGTSSIGDLIYSRSLTEDYDHLAFDSWGSEMSYRVLERLENYNGPDNFNIKYGKSGYIKLDYANFTDQPKGFLKAAYKDMGLLSLSHRHALGYSDFLKMRSAGERRNMARDFLTPIKDRPNLFFTKNTEVINVEITERFDKRAHGVNVNIRGQKLFIRARKEVILTAGAINNPKILLLSGLGPCDYLKKMKIHCHIDLPAVGKNLQFHLTLPFFVSYINEDGSEDYYSDTDVIKETYDYIIHRTGDLSNTNINEFVTFVSTNKSNIIFPNLAIRHHYFRTDDRRLLGWIKARGYHPKIITNLLKKNKNRAIILFQVILIKPDSRGQVFLNDSTIEGAPKIVSNFFSDIDNRDLDTLISGFDFITNLTYTFRKQIQFLDLGSYIKSTRSNRESLRMIISR